MRPNKHRHSQSSRSRSGNSPTAIPSGHRLVIGDHAIQELIRINSKNIDKIFLKDNWTSSQELRDLDKFAREQKVRIEVINEQTLDRFGSHQGAAAIVKGQPELDLDAVCKKDEAIILALDGLEDPHNLGAIFRTSWLMGVSGLLITQDRSAGLTPVVHKVASGGVEHVPCEQVNQFKPAFDHLRENGFWVFGLSHKAKKTVYELKIPEKVVWVLGSEGKGLRTTTEKDCDELVCLPQASADASYNVSVAAGMALAETRRQHRK